MSLFTIDYDKGGWGSEGMKNQILPQESQGVFTYALQDNSCLSFSTKGIHKWAPNIWYQQEYDIGVDCD